jgi:SAM-dependent methyltransferase
VGQHGLECRRVATPILCRPRKNERTGYRHTVTATGGNDLPTVGSPSFGSSSSRQLLSRHLVGSGLELGPGHIAFPVIQPGTHVRYVDRWDPEENRKLFPELTDTNFITPDVVADLNIDRLQAFPDQSQDFVICSHVVEHLAEPIGLLADLHRILRPGGVLLILLPDRHRTFDRSRDGTPLDHLVAEFESGVTEVDAAHIHDFAEKTGTPLGASASQRRANIELHLKRSIHVHCWDDEEFFSVLLYTVEHLSQRWEFVDGVLSEDEGPLGMEFGFVLRRGDSALGSSELHERLDRSWHTWRDARLSIVREIHELRTSEGRLLREAADLRLAQSDPARRGHGSVATAHRLLDRFRFWRRAKTSDS